LVVLADPGEGDAVVDLADLPQRVARVLGDDGDAVVVGERHQAPAPGDALAGVVGPVLHHLLGRDVEGHAHEWFFSPSRAGVGPWAVTTASLPRRPCPGAR